MRLRIGMAWMAALGVACGGSSDTTSGPDAPAYARVAQGISDTAASYASTAGATTDVASCRSAHDGYDAQVRPMVDRMRSMSGGMDQQMQMMGDPAGADMTCGADAMAAELGHHDQAACASADMSANHAEAQRHATAMRGWADHQRARADQMSGMMGGGGMAGGVSAATCHRNIDGTFTLGP